MKVITGTKDGKLEKRKNRKKKKLKRRERRKVLFKDKIFFVDVVEENDHEVYTHYYSWFVKQMGATVIKKLPKNYKISKRKPDYIVWE